jgi:flavin-dependent dehydrogenase
VQGVQQMAALWPELLDRPHVRGFLGPAARPEAPHRAWPIPARVDRATLTGRRTLFVGDAATATDPLTGEGIGQALLTGVLAAEAVLAHPHEAGAATAAYRVAAERALVADHRMSMLLIRAVRHRRGVRVGLRVAGATAWTRRNFGRWLFEDYPRALVATPRRWRRGMVSGPGAYRTR